MFAAPAPVEAAAAVVAPKRKKKNNAQIAGVLKNTKYYYAPDGSIIDDQGKPAPDKIAAYFPPHEKREAIAAAMPKAPGIKAATKATGVPSKVIKQFNKNISIATNLITTNQKIMESYPKLFEQMSGVVQKMTEQNEAIIQTVIKNNQEFQDKVIETLTGVKAPTQAGGSVAPKPGRKGAGRKSLKAGRSAAVLSRAKSIKQAKGRMSTGAAIGLAVAGAAAVGVGAALINNASSPGGAGTGAETPPGGMWPNTPASGSNKQILETIKKRESGGNYNIRSNSSSASGAYQFIDSTWRSRAQAAGVDVRQYPRAFMAPPDVQDKVADVYISEVLRQNNNDVSKIPLVWYTGNAQGRMSANALAVNRGLTPQAYQASWMKTYQQMGGSVATAQQTTPAAPASTGGPTTTTPATATTGAPERRPSATPEEAAMHQTNVGMLQNLNNLTARKGPGGRLGEANAAKKKELEEKIAAYNQKFSMRPMQQAGTVTPLVPGSQPGQQAQVGSVRPLDTTGVGPIGNLSNILPSGNIVALGKALQGMGIKVSEHPAFGPVGQHAPGSAHYSGRAIDVNGPPGMVEANDPVWGPKFDKLAESMRAAGYKVIWRSAGHYNHLHAQISAGGDTTPVPGAPAPDYYAGGNNNRVGAASQSYAMDRNAASCACPPTIINNTMINDNIRTIMQPSAMQFGGRHNFGTPFNQSAYAAGAAIGGLLRRLF
jgi:hypothetical protein